MDTHALSLTERPKVECLQQLLVTEDDGSLEWDW